MPAIASRLRAAPLAARVDFLLRDYDYFRATRVWLNTRLAALRPARGNSGPAGRLYASQFTAHTGRGSSDRAPRSALHQRSQERNYAGFGAPHTIASPHNSRQRNHRGCAKSHRRPLNDTLRYTVAARPRYARSHDQSHCDRNPPAHTCPTALLCSSPPCACSDLLPRVPAALTLAIALLAVTASSRGLRSFDTQATIRTGACIATTPAGWRPWLAESSISRSATSADARGGDNACVQGRARRVAQAPYLPAINGMSAAARN